MLNNEWNCKPLYCFLLVLKCWGFYPFRIATTKQQYLNVHNIQITVSNAFLYLFIPSLSFSPSFSFSLPPHLTHPSNINQVPDIQNFFPLFQERHKMKKSVHLKILIDLYQMELEGGNHITADWFLWPTLFVNLEQKLVHKTTCACHVLFMSELCLCVHCLLCR